MSYIQSMVSVDEESRLIEDRASAATDIALLNAAISSLAALPGVASDYVTCLVPGMNFLPMFTALVAARNSAIRHEAAAEHRLDEIDAERRLSMVPRMVRQIVIQAGQP